MYKYIYCSIALLACHYSAFSQGCADAGFCSVGAIHATTFTQQEEHSTIGISSAVGLGEKFLLAVSPQLEYKQITGKKNYLEFKLPFHIISGNLGTNYGIGDLITTFTASLSVPSSKYQWHYTAGLRIGFGNADDTKNGKPLPMAYQTSLGTTDIILGGSLQTNKQWTFAVGWQQPVVQYNYNGYYTTDDHDSVSTAYFSSRKLRRNGDVLLRADYKKSWKHTGFRAGALTLYHLANDKATAPNDSSLTLKNSSGITININFGFYYQTPKWILDFTLAGPVHARDNRPDGLTRNAVFIPRFILKL